MFACLFRQFPPYVWIFGRQLVVTIIHASTFAKRIMLSLTFY